MKKSKSIFTIFLVSFFILPAISIDNTLIQGKDLVSEIIIDVGDFKYYTPKELLDSTALRSILISDSVFLNSDWFRDYAEHLLLKNKLIRTEFEIDSMVKSDSRSQELDTEIQIHRLEDALRDDSLFFEFLFEEHMNIISEQVGRLDTQRKWIFEKIISKPFLDRMKMCFQGNQYLALLYRERYASNILNGEYFFSNHLFSSRKNSSGHCKNNQLFLSYASYNEIYGDCECEFTPIHELEHQANVSAIPPFVSELFKEKFSEKRFLRRNCYTNKYNYSYYSKPTEILARKRVFDYELELRGIKNYCEEFTIKHYEKVQTLVDRYYLDNEGEQFFFMFEKEDLIFIMNTVP